MSLDHKSSELIIQELKKINERLEKLENQSKSQVIRTKSRCVMCVGEDSQCQKCETIDLKRIGTYN